MTAQLAPADCSVRLAAADAALIAVLRLLNQRGYRFVTPTPASHARVLARDPQPAARDLRDVLGWSMPFAAATLDDEILTALDAAEAIETLPDGRLRCRYRVSSLGEALYLHSAYPTDAPDAVFFGPDSYRFAALIERELRRCPRRPAARLVDIGAGAGVGAIVAARLCPDLRLTMTDINAQALRLAGINARAAGLTAELASGSCLDPVQGPVDIAVANPPYLVDGAGRDYRDGGDMHGAQVACDMASAALDRLAPEGRFILYTGSAIIAGEDRLRAALARLCAERDCGLRYWEIDPDVFGEELVKPAYRQVDRIAAVGAVLTRRAAPEPSASTGVIAA